MNTYLIKNAIIINEGKRLEGDVLIKNERIEKIAASIDTQEKATIIDATGMYLIPGAIDDQVHFRQPGLTYKATIATESKAGVAGGVTSFMEMPNTVPPCFTQDLLEEKYQIAQQTALSNFSFYMGTSNDNYEAVMQTNKKKNSVCGIKIFMGASTGNLLVDNPLTLDKVFANAELLIATHCEDERIIHQNFERIKAENRAFRAADHPLIRDEIACFESSLKAIQLAKKYQSRLHILHISTAQELQLFSNFLPLKDKKITAEVCVHHLHFTADDYAVLENQIKCNPAIKAPQHKLALWEGLLNDQLDLIATDHAPHLWAEKNEPYLKAHAGLPLVQHSLSLMLHYEKLNQISLEKIVEKMCHNPAICFQIADRGFIREGYFADLVLLNPKQKMRVERDNILYKCGWSPLEGFEFPMAVDTTFVNGNLVYKNGVFNTEKMGKRLVFDRT